MTKHQLITKIVKLGKKGQITIPRKIVKKEHLKERDKFVLTQLPNGEIRLKKQVENPEKKLLALIKTFEPFDWRKAWEEVKEERKREC